MLSHADTSPAKDAIRTANRLLSIFSQRGNVEIKSLFCKICEVKIMTRCKKCGVVLPDTANFCLMCGVPLKSEKPKKAKKHYRPRGTGSIKYDARNRNAPYVACLPKSAGGGYVGSFASYDEANAFLLRETAKMPTSDRANWSVRQFYDAFLLSDSFTSQGRDGQNSMKAAWKYCEDVANLRMRDVMGTLWQSCIDKAAAAGKSKSTCEKVRVLISAICKEAMRDNIISQNYSKLLVVKGTQKREKDIFTQAEIDKLKKHDKDVEARFILILIYTGMRINELLNMQYSDVHIDEGYMVGGEKTEAGKHRVIPILPIIRPYVSQFCLECGFQGELIKRNGKKIRVEYARKKWFYNYLASIGILTVDEIAVGGKPRLTPHCTRHTFATIARQSGVDKDVLTRIIGHSDYTVTDEVYVSMQADFLGAELAKIVNA